MRELHDAPERAAGAVAYRLSPDQQRLWFLQQLAPGSCAYNVPFVARIAGPLDEAALRAALARVLARQDAFATRIVNGADGPVQVADVPLDVPAVTDLRAAGGEAAALRAARELAAAPFDLAHGVTRIGLWRAGDDVVVLALVVHHVVVDEWSFAVFGIDLAHEYRAARGEAEPLPPLEPGFGHVAEELARTESSADTAFWREYLDGAPETAFPPDTAPAGDGFGPGGAVTVELPGALGDALRRFVRERSTTPFLVGITALAALLARWCGEDDVVIGTPFTRRTQPEMQPLVGFLLNTLPVRLQTPPERSFADALRDARARWLRVVAHSALGFDRIVEAARSERRSLRTPLFSVMFVALARDAAPALLGEARFEPVVMLAPTAKIDLTVTLTSGAAGWSITLEYDRDRYRERTMERLAHQFAAVLEAVVRDPAAPLGALDLRTPGERAAAQAAGAQPPLAPASPVALFEAAADRTPDAVALEDGERRWRYDELDAQANRIAAFLAARGIGVEDRVGIALPSSATAAAAVLGVLKSGAAYLPVDAGGPPERRAAMLRLARPRLVLTDRAGAAALPDDARATALDAVRDELAALPASRPAVAIPAEATAYVLFTSGSTGVPKGVAMPHGALANLAAWRRRALGTDGERKLQYSPLGFDASFSELFSTWAGSGTVVVVPPELRTDFPALAAFVRERRITALQLPYAALAALAAADPRALETVGVATSTAEALRLTPDLAAAFAAAPGCRVANEYGPTETHVATWHALAPQAREELPPIGVPIDGARAYVLDRGLVPCPAGAVGELYLAGAVLARGYLDRPGETAARFLPDPFVPGARMYRTGDFARRGAGGALEYRGRRDDQLKIRGFRVELGEVESVLARHPGVGEVVVVPRRDGGETRLVAYYTRSGSASGEPADAFALRAFAAGWLTDALLPAAYVRVDAFPLTANGKADRRALPAPTDADFARGAPYAPPRTALERALVAIWSALLGRDAIGIDDDFFDLGGHSLLAARVVARLDASEGVRVPLRAVFELRTVRAIAASAQPATAAEPRAVPASPAQRRLWLLDRMTDEPVYNVPLVLRLEGQLDARALRASFDDVVQRHETLRTALRTNGGELEQIVHDRVDGYWNALAEPDPRAHGALVARLVRERLDLAQAPLLRATLIDAGGGASTLVLVFHHAIVDGESFGPMLDELSAGYEARTGGAPAAFAPVRSYAEAMQDQRRARRPGDLDYWGRALAAPRAVATWPYDRTLPAARRFRGAHVAFTIGEASAAAARALARSLRATPYQVLLAAFDVLLARAAGERDVTVGTPYSRRPRGDAAVGMYVETLAVRVDVGEVPFRELVVRVRNALLAAMEHASVSFDEVVARLETPRAASGSPLFAAFFGMIDGIAARTRLGRLRVTPVDVPTQTAKFDLTVLLADSGGTIHGVLEYDTDLYDEATMRRAADLFVRAVDVLCANPELCPAELRLAGEREPEAPRRHGPHVHRVFEARAAAAPLAPAFARGSTVLAYGELDARANAFAHELLARGARPGDRVGILLERSAAALVALLGTLKAGCAFVPLDARVPAGRLAEIAARARPFALVADGPPPAELAALPLLHPAASLPEPTGAPPSGDGDAALACVAFDVDSAGRLDEVAVDHGAFAAYVRSAAERYDARAGGGAAAALASLLAPLARGGCVHVDPPAQADADVERILAILRDALGSDELGAGDDFFDEGGHSLSAGTAVARIDDAFGVELPLRAFFAAPTALALAAAVRALTTDADASAPPAAGVTDITDTAEFEAPAQLSAAAASPAQRRLWLFHAITEGPLYNIPAVVRLNGAVDAEAMRASFDDVVRRHDALRTSLRMNGGELEQVVHERVDGYWATAVEHDADALPALLERLVSHRFDLTQAPLLRATLIDAGERTSVLALVFHHAVVDGESFRPILDELRAGYDARVAGAPLALPPVSTSYAQATEELRRARRPADLDYWEARLAAPHALAAWPADRRRGAAPHFRGGRLPLEIGPDAARAVRALARARGATTYQVLLAAFDALLARASGERDVIVGIPYSRRPRNGAASVGMYVETLAVRVDVADEPFGELVERVRDALLEAMEHASVPFDEIVMRLQPPREPSGSPLFASFFGMTHRLGGGPSFAGTTAEPLDVPSRMAKFDFSVLLDEERDVFSGILEYDADLYDERTMERAAGLYVRAVETLCEDPSLRPSDLALCGDAERRALLAAAAGPRPGRAPQVHRAFEVRAAAAPLAPAVVDGARTIAYGELDSRANAFAHELLARGARPGARIGVLLERSLAAVVALLGTLKAGCAFVPLDAGSPPLRLAAIAAEARLFALAADGAPPELGAIPVLLPAEDAPTPAVPAPAVDVADAELAYVIFTSGSTGRPKGVAVEHGPFASYVRFAAEAYTAEGDADSALFTPLHVDLTLTSIFAPLVRGGCVHVVPACENAAETAALLGALPPLAFLKLTPSHVTLLGALPAARRLPACRTAVLGGEQVTTAHVRALEQARPGIVTINEYGPTETVVACAAGTAAAGAPDALVPVGAPLDDARTYVLDAALRLVPPGMVGEIYAGGTRLARGYDGRPGATAAAFLPDPYAPEPGGRMYRTGDLGRYDAAGRLVCLGRRDRQIKRRGIRIEPEEIAHALGALDGVRAAVVLAHGAGSSPRLTAYVVPRDAAAPPSLRELKDAVAARLPRALWPDAYALAERLPQAAGGKLDETHLAREAAPLTARDAARALPRDADEQRILTILEETLGARGLGVDDDFFDRGGHSLAAVAAAARIDDAFGVRLPLSVFFAAPTAATLAQTVRSLAAGAHSFSPLVALEPSGTLPPLVLIHGAGGNVLRFAELARAFGDERPVYGLEARGCYGECDPAPSVGAMADDYGALIRARFGDGPYAVGGWCFGASIAFETASRLAAGGASVEHLVLMYNPAPHPYDVVEDETWLMAAFAGHQGLGVRFEDLAAAGAEGRFALLLRAAAARGLLREETGAERLAALLRVYRANLGASRSYAPRPARLRTTVVRLADEHYPGIASPALGWERLVGDDFTVLLAGGDHDSMLRGEHARDLAARLGAALRSPH